MSVELNKGQISPIILWTGGIIATAFFAFAGWTTNKLGNIDNARVADIQRITTTEVDQKTLKEDVREIKADVKILLKVLNVK